MHKKDALAVGQVQLNITGELHYTNSDSNACGVIEHSFGKKNTTVLHDASTGSASGLLKVALSSYFVNCLVIVGPNLMLSRTTGWSRCPRNKLTTLRSNIWSMMLPTFIRTDVC